MSAATPRPGSPHSTPAAVVVPVKDFTEAKRRLAPELSDIERRDIAERMATIVVRAAAPLPVYVVCDTENVRTWAASIGANVLWTPGLGLNGAVQTAVERLAALGIGRAVVSHADLPLATSFTEVVAGSGVTIVPDRHLDGSNVVSVPTDIGFEFAYGAGSFGAHRAEAARRGQVLRILRDDRLGWDVDVAADLDYPNPADPRPLTCTEPT